MCLRAEEENPEVREPHSRSQNHKNLLPCNLYIQELGSSQKLSDGELSRWRSVFIAVLSVCMTRLVLIGASRAVFVQQGLWCFIFPSFCFVVCLFVFGSCYS